MGIMLENLLSKIFSSTVVTINAPCLFSNLAKCKGPESTKIPKLTFATSLIKSLIFFGFLNEVFFFKTFSFINFE